MHNISLSKVFFSFFSGAVAIGDKVLFTSTDYDMDQAEIGHVQQCDDCSSPNEIRVSCRLYIYTVMAN
jgi:hypothetical protein